MSDPVVFIERLLRGFRCGLLLVGVLTLGFGLFSAALPGRSIGLYQGIMRWFNWRVSPINEPRELRNTKRLGVVLVVLSVVLFWLIIGTPSAWASVEPTTERITEVGTLEQTIGKLKLKGAGKLSSQAIGLRGTVQWRRLFESPLFLSGESRFAREQRLPYDLLQWGGTAALGWALDEHTDLMVRYRLDSYKVSDVGSDADGAFQTVRGRTAVTALGAGLQQDRRDDRWYPTRGSRLSLTGELGLEGLGGGL